MTKSKQFLDDQMTCRPGTKCEATNLNARVEAEQPTKGCEGSQTRTALPNLTFKDALNDLP